VAFLEPVEQKRGFVIRVGWLLRAAYGPTVAAAARSERESGGVAVECSARRDQNLRTQGLAD
jgi:hypothetical protein